MADLNHSTEHAIRDAIAALQQAEAVIASINRASALKLLEELRDMVEKLPAAQLDMRMARLRLQAFVSDLDKTPIPSGISQQMARIRKKSDDDET